MAGAAAGSEFEDEDVVRCYRHRAPYPSAVYERLAGLAAGAGALLDLGCGPGKLALGLAERFARIDAVDPSPAMLTEARRACGRVSKIRWLQAAAEEAAFEGPYDLAVSGAAIHWMDHPAVMPKLAATLRAKAPLALVEGDGPSAAPWRAAFQAVIVRWVERAGRTWEDTAHRRLVTAHEAWFDIEGQETFAHTIRQSVEDLIEAQHSRATWARFRMGADAAAEFDAELRGVLAPHAEEGLVVFDVETRLSWGQPRYSRKP